MSPKCKLLSSSYIHATLQQKPENPRIILWLLFLQVCVRVCVIHDGRGFIITSHHVSALPDTNVDPPTLVVSSGDRQAGRDFQKVWETLLYSYSQSLDF